METPNNITNVNLKTQPLIFPLGEIGARAFAEVIIPLYLPKTLTWQVPQPFAQKIQIGCRVEVSLGKNKKYAGVVKSLHNNAPYGFEPKPIINLLDDSPIVYEHQLKLWNWIADYYACTEGEVMGVALPAYLKLSSETIIYHNEESEIDVQGLSDSEFIIAEALDIKKELKLLEVQKLLDSIKVYPIIKSLIDKGICYVQDNLGEKYKPRLENFIDLHADYRNEAALEKLVNSWSKAPKQLDLLLAFLHIEKNDGAVLQSALIKKANTTAAILKGLIDKNILTVEKKNIDRLANLPKCSLIDFELNPDQKKALAEVENSFTQKEVCLLHGVTGSGKTMVYIKLIEALIRNGEQALFLLPEIALTSQIIRKLQHHFGGHVGIYHSKFNPNERVELWNKVRTGEILLVVGARSALFLPFNNLKLIIVDEEHDTSFKQHEPAPRYHARDAAIFYAHSCKAKVLLGSATPSLETYFNAKEGKFGLVELNERFGNIDLPDIELIDLKLPPIFAPVKVLPNLPGTIIDENLPEKETKVFNNKTDKIILTPTLQLAIANTILQKKQVIIFQNRRGYSPYQVCQTCGWIPQCEHCDISLSYHKATNKLHCHYCGSTYAVAKNCIACGNQNFTQKNFGTERIEEALEEVFPDARIQRMDTDSVKGKNSHEALIKMFEQGRIDILVGTQMVVKGLDFDHVGLVGIIDADAILSFADFRVHERAFQLMEQVSGRAGRKGEKGKMLVQIRNIHHPLLPVLQAHDYKKLYETEIETRRQFFYPPYSRIIIIECRHVDKQIAQDAAQLLANGLHQQYQKFLNGPAEPAVNRIRNQYIFELMLKLPKQIALLQQCKKHIKEMADELQHLKQFKSVKVIIDVDAI